MSGSTLNKDNESFFPSRGLPKLESCVSYQEFTTSSTINSTQMVIVLKPLATNKRANRVDRVEGSFRAKGTNSQSDRGLLCFM